MFDAIIIAEPPDGGSAGANAAAIRTLRDK
jgi:hypothetical protein